MVAEVVPFMVAVLVVEALVLLLALLVAGFRVLVRPVRWLTRGLAAVSLVVGAAMVVDVGQELRQTDYPLVLPGQPFGSYAQPTDLMLLEMVAVGLVVVVAALLAFRHPRPAGLLFLAAGVVDLLGSLRQYHDPTTPPGNATFGVVVAGGPPLMAGALLLALWWADRRTGLPTAPRARPAAPAGAG